MIVYLDVNVVLDFLLGNREFSIEVAQVISLLSSDAHEMYTAPNSIIMAFFHLRKEPNSQTAKDIKHTLALFRKRVVCVTVEGTDVDKAIALSTPQDLEDGFQIILASKCGAEVLLTNDKKGFRDAPMKVMSSKRFLQEWEFN
jgi:predicted nucleic acid-binding protein